MATENRSNNCKGVFCNGAFLQFASQVLNDNFENISCTSW